jgi:hypothetical protein
MIYTCLLKGDNVFREVNGITKLMGFIARVTVDSEMPGLVEPLALAKIRESDFMRELKDKGTQSVLPKLSLIGISKSAGMVVLPIEFTWFPMDELV